MLVASVPCVMTSCSGDDEEELIPEDTIAKYTKAIVGYWLLDGTQEYWRFDANGDGVAYGENWDAAEDVHEGEGNKFKWYIDKNGLMVIYKLETIDEYNDPEPMAPFSIKSITDTNMHWVTSTGIQQSLTRVQK